MSYVVSMNDSTEGQTDKGDDADAERSSTENKENHPEFNRGDSIDDDEDADRQERPTVQRRASKVKLVRQNSNIVGPIVVEVQDDKGNIDFPQIEEPEDDPGIESGFSIGEKLTLDDVEVKIAPIIREAEVRKKALEQLLVEHASLVAKINSDERTQKSLTSLDIQTGVTTQQS